MLFRRILALLPGLAVSVLVAVAAMLLEHMEVAELGRPWLEALVIAILLGAAVNLAIGLRPAWLPGIRFAARTVLEVAIVLLGASVSLGAIVGAGWELVAAIVAVVMLALAAGYLIGRALGLSRELATLVACGNAICGNSAIMAAAPVIEAEPDDVAASVAFTAVLGVVVVLVLPLAVFRFGMSEQRYGILAGMTVYAVPQVLAATAPVGALAMQVGTLVKLVRVLMLGPVIMVLGRSFGRGASRPPIHHLVPWFIVGFLAMAALRSLDLLPAPALAPAAILSSAFAVVSMAALGLTVDVRGVARAGGRVLGAGVLSLLALTGIGFAALAVLHLAV
jgi:uncharacterized integral membrane protein (TIGR00698 family)